MRRLYTLAILSLFLFLLPACFDYQVNLDLKSDGSGSVAFSLNVPAGYNTSWDTPLVRRIFNPEPIVSQPFLIDDDLRFDELVNFNYLGELRLSKIAWRIQMIDTGLLGITSYTYRITTILAGAEGIAAEYGVKPSGFQRQEKQIMPWEQSPAQDKALRLRGEAAEDHMISIVQSLPGQVVRAESIKLGNFLVEPIIDGNKVTWQIPLAQLIVNDVRSNLHFSAEFRGNYKPHTRFAPAWASRLN